MNTRQLQYAVMLANDRNFSQVAAKLNITQPALSKYIMNLEQELGVKLFDRSVTPLGLTPAGERFIQEARELLFREEQLLRQLEDYKNGGAGRLTIGLSPFRSVYMMPPVVGLIRENFPEMQVVLCERVGEDLHEALAEGQCDFAVMNLPVDETLFDFAELRAETVVLAVSDELLRSHGMAVPEKNSAAYPVFDPTVCEALPFVMLGKNQELPQLFSRLCAAAGVHPRISVEVVNITTAWAMAQAGVGATILPVHFIQGAGSREGMSLFAIRGAAYVRRPAIVWRRGQYLSRPAQYAMELLKSRLA